jgi:Tfp pilus assembly protein PilF
LYEQGQYPEAEPLLVQAVRIREQTLGPEHPDTATSLSNLAIFYADLHHFRQAEQLFERALEICEKVFGPKHPRTLQVLENYIAVLLQAKRNVKAKALKKRLKAIKGGKTYQEIVS